MVEDRRTPDLLGPKVLLQSVVGFALGALLLFVPAGDAAWPQGWIFLLLFCAGSEAPTLWLLRRDPDLLRERMRSPLAAGQRRRDRALMLALLLTFLGWIVFMALDARRFGWSRTPDWAQALGAGLMVGAFAGWFAVL